MEWAEGIEEERVGELDGDRNVGRGAVEDGVEGVESGVDGVEVRGAEGGEEISRIEFCVCISC